MKILSICIPSYNRPKELLRLLESIDIKERDDIEIVICEDHAPKRREVRESVERYKKRTSNKYYVNYIENDANYGYDRNLRECIKNATGKWVMFMGDDDLFVMDTMDEYLCFLKQQQEVGYVLRSYRTIHDDGSIENFKYYDETSFFDPGESTYVELFRKSVFISGFCFLREAALENMTDIFDGTLLYQLYLMGEICMKYKAAYYGIPFTQSTKGGIPYFGTSEKEKELYTPGTITLDNSIQFMKGFFVIAEFMDHKYDLGSTQAIKMDISKYSYPILSIQRKKGRKIFREYHKSLCELELNVSKYYKMYYILLYLFGEKSCDIGIRTVKRVLGKTPKL